MEVKKKKREGIVLDKFKCFMDSLIIVNGIIKINQKRGFLSVMALANMLYFTKQQL